MQARTDALERRHVGQLTCYVIACCVCVTDIARLACGIGCM